MLDHKVEREVSPGWAKLQEPSIHAPEEAHLTEGIEEFLSC